ncbi:gliding motility protein GldN [Sphingobacterium sp. N143]|uniref:type IX secretion system ring protein PorN/GldN n=1 Tax=Sphingobacterium sp. N143 TaxID=2746727 RepID=UPI00257722BF|nr:gliding motility protein GldN [Sphingobacterium sp. N143]MDM1295922.1 gliding motility protein GldN [Sphingobacterium sp. N143]
MNMKIVTTIVMALGFGLAMAQEVVKPDTLIAEQPDTLNTGIPTTDIVPQGEVNPDTIPTTDGFYQANSMEDAVPFAYPEVNRKNIRFYKRVWRDIDLKDEKNYILAIPGNSLIEVIMKAIEKGKLSLYSPDDDSFKGRLSAQEGMARFADSVLVPIFDDEGNQIDSKMALNEFDPARVTKFRVKEDIFFDKQRGRLETRIIGVAPLMNITTSAELAESVGSTPAFWLYFPQLRYSLVQVDISDPDKGLYEMTMDDFFVQNKFASSIVRESSPGMLQNVKESENGGQFLDGRKVEEKLDAYKKKLWSNPKGVKAEELEGHQSKSEMQEGNPPKTEQTKENKTEIQEENQSNGEETEMNQSQTEEQTENNSQTEEKL